jgi:cytochrome c oxidase assembly protein subunit 11
MNEETPNDTQQLKRANRRLARNMLLIAVVMFGFGFALVPLYNVFCSATGLNGKTSNQPARVKAAQTQPEDRLVTIEFLSNPGTTSGWHFHPAVTKLRVHPGQLYSTHYLARNPTDHPVIVRAVPSVAPGLAAQYLQKTECFCFTRQVFAPGEARDLPLRFMINPEVPSEVGTLSLAYTLYVQDSSDAKLLLAKRGKFTRLAGH